MPKVQQTSRFRCGSGQTIPVANKEGDEDGDPQGKEYPGTSVLLPIDDGRAQSDEDRDPKIEEITIP